jgi:hypothetical protein
LRRLFGGTGRAVALEKSLDGQAWLVSHPLSSVTRGWYRCSWRPSAYGGFLIGAGGDVSTVQTVQNARLSVFTMNYAAAIIVMAAMASVSVERT